MAIVRVALILALSSIIINGAIWAQPSKLISKSAERSWKTHTSTFGFSIDLPDFLKAHRLDTVTLDSKPFQFQAYEAVPKSLNSIKVLIFPRKGSDENTLKKLYLIDKKESDSSLFQNSTYEVWSRHIEDKGDPELDAYFKGTLTQNRIYLIEVAFEPHFRRALQNIIPRIMESFRAIR
jgi:hypothetical protein